MAEDDPALKGLKALLRSTLQSMKGGVPVNQLNRDYRELSGQGIPFRERGFSNLEQFLQSIPDVVTIIWKDGQMHCMPVADQKTAHIQKMVSAQRSVKKKKKRGGWGGMRRPAPRYDRYRKVPTTPRPAPVPNSRRTVAQSPRGSVKVSIARSPVQTIKFGASYRVPPRFQRQITSQRPDISIERNTQMPVAASPTPSRARTSDRELNICKGRVADLMAGKTNGLWFSRLPVLYKETYREEAPPHLSQLLQQWPDVVSILPTHAGNQMIIYPAVKESASPPITRPALLPTPKIDRTFSQETLHEVPTSKASDDTNVELNFSIKDPVTPEIGSQHQVYISYVSNLGHFYVHLADCQINAIMKNLNGMYNNDCSHPVKNLQCGMHVAAKCSDDDLWYRAKILDVQTSSNSKNCDVFYIDFGNTEAMPDSRVQELQAKCYDHPVQAVLCTLDGVYPRRDGSKWEEATNEMVKYQEEQNCSIKVTGTKGKKSVVNFYVGNMCLNDALLKKGLVRSTPIDHVREPGPLVLPSESDWVVEVSEVVSANQVKLRFLGENYSDKLEELEETISKTPLPERVSVPEVGDLCAAKIAASTEEGEIPWYRVRIKEVLQDKVTCECLDYGEDIEDIAFSMIRPLSPDEAVLPFQAVVAFLSGLEGCEGDQEMKDRLVDMALGRPLIATVESREGDPSIILYDTNTEVDIKINEALVSNTATAPPKLPKEGDLCEVYLAHVDVDANIYIQVQGPGLLELDSLTTEVSETLSAGGAEYFVTDLVEGKMVLAPYGDGGWYRGTIEELLPNRMVLLHFVDYGNHEIVRCNTLRDVEKVSKKLYNLPHQAIAVSLDMLPPSGRSWTDTAVDELSHLAPPELLIQVETIKAGHDDSLPLVHLYRVEHSAELNQSAEIEYYSINEEITDPKFWTVRPESPAAATPPTDTDSDVNTSFSEASVASQQAHEVLRETEGLLRDLGIADTSGLLSLSQTSQSETSQPQSVTTDLAPVCGTGENDKHYEAKSPDDFSSSPQTPSEMAIKTCKDLNSNETQLVKPKGEGDQLRLPPSLKLPENGSQVYITAAADPSNFKCVVSSALPHIEEMMDKMARFFFGEGEGLVVEKADIGGIYAALYDNSRWYRIQVKNVVNQPLLGNCPMVSAHLVDYGEVHLLRLTDLRHLPTEFRQLPFQAIQARLAGIGAEAGIWGEEAIERFESLALEKTMVAWFHNRDAQSIVNITLVEPGTEGEDGMLHKILIKEGLAVSYPFPTL